MAPRPVLVLDQLTANVAALATDLVRVGCDAFFHAGGGGGEAASLGPQGLWRVSAANATFRMTPSYPDQLPVPASLTDKDLHDMVGACPMARLPVVSWLSKNGAALCRCGGESVGSGEAGADCLFLVFRSAAVNFASRHAVGIERYLEALRQVGAAR